MVRVRGLTAWGKGIKWVCVSWALLVCLSGNVMASSMPSLPGGEVVVIADVHGAYNELTTMLQRAGLIDTKHNWAGGKRTLISLGDLVDRGPHSRRVIELMMRLQGQARSAGGELVQLLGNHEIMLMTGDYRYVTPVEFAAYADLSSPTRREVWYQAYVNGQGEEDAASTRARFDSLFPIGASGMAQAFGPDGHIGRWLRSQTHSLYKHEERLYVHGGLSPAFADKSLAQINQAVAEALMAHDQAMQAMLAANVLPYTNGDYSVHALVSATEQGEEKPTWWPAAQAWQQAQASILTHPLGPFWYRGNATCPQAVESFSLAKVFKAFAASHLVVGHTPKYKHITSRVNGQVVLADTGMLQAYYDGRASAVWKHKRDWHAAYAEEAKLQGIESESAAFMANPKGMSDAEVEQALLQGKVLINTPISEGVTHPHKLTMEYQGRQFNAVFKGLDTQPGLERKKYFRGRDNSADRYQYEVAAYKLDRLLGQYMVPPTVIREIDGKAGALQLWVEQALTENQRLDNSLGYRGECDLMSQVKVRIVFDVLIHNTDRNNGNLLWDRGFNLYLIDHSRAFAKRTRIPKMYEGSKIKLSGYYREALLALDQARLTDALGDYLHRDQIEAILARREQLLKVSSRLKL